MEKWWMVLASQIWHLPFLAIYILGLVFAFSRRHMGVAATYARVAFSLLIVGSLVSSANNYMMVSWRMEGMSPLEFAKVSGAIAMVTMALNLGAWGLILAAIFAKRPPSPVE
jgi:hypothetical protein